MAKKKKKAFKLSPKAYLVAAIAIALVGVSGAVSAKLDLGQALVDKLADKVPVELLLERLGLGEVAEEFGLTLIDSTNTNLTNLRLEGDLSFQSSVDADKFAHIQFDVEDWPAATSSIRFTNNRSTTSTVKRVILDGSGTGSQVVSSTVMFSCGNVNASPAYAYNSAQGTRPGGVIDGYLAVTSSQPYFDSMSSTTPSVLVGPGESLDCLAQAQSENDLVCNSDGAQCESVTSTNRGWDMNVIVEWGWIEE